VTASDRHIVQIFNQKGTQLLATIRAIPDRRLTPTGDTVVVFGERPAGVIKAITHWFYPGDTEGHEFLY
jgi:hypothetical protein